uniref:Plasmid replication protein n=1 Tax=uncultured prokaryote TaxID=198431 RepID=A0A0H5PV67_9ZZZZ|nr:hypothetical protein [uncultured prokaryote]
MAEKNVKKRHWAMVLYPESAPQDWREQLKKAGIKCAISPLHDKDVNPDGEPKKAHYHVIMSYEGPTTYNNVKRLTDSLSQPIPQPLEQVRGYYRYLTHEDNPEKYQYEKKDIETLNGFAIQDFVEMTKSEVGKRTREILQLIRDNGITEYSILMDILMDAGEGMSEHFEVARTNTLFFKAYLTSQWRRQTGQDGPQAAPGRPPENEEGKRPSGASAAQRENREPPR